jgi:hypothetical protein
VKWEVDDPVLLAQGGIAQTLLPVGHCGSTFSEFQCVGNDTIFSRPEPATTVGANGNVGTTTETVVACPIILPVNPPPLLPSDPSLPEIDKCFLDNRCVSTTDFNTAIVAAAALAPADDITKDFTIVITVVISSGGGIINLGVDVIGDREPVALELPNICKIVSNSVSANLKFNPDRVEKCQLSKVTSNAVKRSVQMTNSYVANIHVTTEPGSGLASALYPALAFLVGVLALLF